MRCTNFHFLRLPSALALVALGLLGACCATHVRDHEPEHDAALYAAHEAPPPSHEGHAAALAPGDVAAEPQPNRDRHGPPDVAHYIDALESDARVAELRVELVLEKLALAPDARVGDLGCGPGVFTLPLARALPRGIVLASDVEPRQLDRLRERVAAAGLTNVVPVLAGYDDPFFPAGRLDLVLIADTLHHIEQRELYLRRLARVLAPGGRLAILELKPGPLPIGPPPEHKLAPGELERTLDEAGWTLVQRFETHPYHDFTLWRPRDAAR